MYLPPIVIITADSLPKSRISSPYFWAFAYVRHTMGVCSLTRSVGENGNVDIVFDFTRISFAFEYVPAKFGFVPVIRSPLTIIIKNVVKNGFEQSFSFF